jgi:hypothetical protein
MEKNDCVEGFIEFFMLQKAYRICLPVYIFWNLIACVPGHADC